MPSTKAQKAAAARAQAAKSKKEMVDSEVVECRSDSDPLAIEPDSEDSHDSEIECTGWNGGVNYVASDTDSDDEDWKILTQIVEVPRVVKMITMILKALKERSSWTASRTSGNSCSRTLKTLERPPRMNTS